MNSSVWLIYIYICTYVHTCISILKFSDRDKKSVDFYFIDRLYLNIFLIYCVSIGESGLLTFAVLTAIVCAKLIKGFIIIIIALTYKIVFSLQLLL